MSPGSKKEPELLLIVKFSRFSVLVKPPELPSEQGLVEIVF